MSESEFGGDHDLTAGSTVEGGGETVDSATADREAAFDDPVRSGAGNLMGEDAVVASPPEGSTVDETLEGPDGNTSQEADVAAGYDHADPAAAQD